MAWERSYRIRVCPTCNWSDTTEKDANAPDEPAFECPNCLKLRPVDPEEFERGDWLQMHVARSYDPGPSTGRSLTLRKTADGYERVDDEPSL